MSVWSSSGGWRGGNLSVSASPDFGSNLPGTLASSGPSRRLPRSHYSGAARQVPPPPLSLKRFYTGMPKLPPLPVIPARCGPLLQLEALSLGSPARGARGQQVKVIRNR